MLPRTGSTYGPHTKAGTSDWAGEWDIRSSAYVPGSVWLGPYFHTSDEAQQLSELLFSLDVTLRSMVMPDQQHEAWRDNALSMCRHHIEVLSRTSLTEIGIDDDRHLVTLGGTRGGKGTTAIIPNLCLYEGSVVCIDPKGENARITAARRGNGSKRTQGMGQRVIVLDPYRESGLPDEYYSSWNPLDLVDQNDPQAIENAAAIADALIIKTSDENAHFDEAARIFIKGLILFVASSKRQDIEGNLLTVYDLLANGARDQLRTEAQASGELEAEKKYDPFDFLLYLMIRQGGFASSVVAGAANMIKGMGQRERGSVLATARRNLEFLERAAIKDTFRSSSFDLDSLKTDEKGVTIYLCLPPQRMHDTSRFLRLMITACLERMYGIKAEPATGKPVLFILDEFASLRHMPVIEHAAGYAAGFGIKLWLILQDITQLKRNYQEAWETFMGNAGVIQAFANSDTASLEYLSKKIGQAEISQQVKSETTQSSVSVSDPSDLQRATLLTSWRAFLSSMNMQTEGQSATNSVSYNQQIKLTPLIQPEELEQCFAREEKNQLVLIKGSSNRPMNIDRWEYFSGWRFLGLFESDKEVPWSDFAEAEREASRRKSDWDAHVSAVLSEAKNYVAELQRDLAELERRLG